MKRTTILSALAGLAVTVASTTAFAGNSAPCTPTSIAWNTGFMGQLTVTCGGVDYYGRVQNGYSLETQKIWMSMLQSALLSGRKVIITYDPSIGVPLIVQVINQ